jgi:SAM-dependent methyltransferase
MAASLVYRSAWLYELIMVGLYGRHYPARYRAIARLVPEGASVLDLCCGPGVLYGRYLRARGVDYTGLDINPQFIARVRRMGARGAVWDLHDDRPLPRADVVLMQASLYHFLPDAAPVVARMRRAARQSVVIAEPVRNLSSSRLGMLRALAQRQTNAGLGAEVRRFTERSLDAFLASHRLEPRESFLIPGGRERIVVLDPSGEETASE